MYDLDKEDDLSYVQYTSMMIIIIIITTGFILHLWLNNLIA